MTETLKYEDTVTRIGYTIIDDVKIVQYVCTIPLDNPQKMRVTSTRLNVDLYKKHRDICRTDLAAFEDAAYELQDKYIAAING